MTVEELNELQQRIAAGTTPSLAECAAMISEIWRLKALVAGKSIERDLASEQSRHDAETLALAKAQIQELSRRLEALRALNEISSCQLENRWSNCAVRQRKRAETQQS